MMNKQPLLAIGILTLGVVAAGAVLVFLGENPTSAYSGVSKWTVPTGLGLSVPACGSSNTSVTCSGSNPLVTINWTDDFSPSDGSIVYDACFRISPGSVVDTYNMVMINAGNSVGGGAAHSYTWTGAANNTQYAYGVYLAPNFGTSGSGNCANPDHIIIGEPATAWGLFSTPSCVIPVTPDYVTEGLATAPGGLTAGQLVTFSATVRNSGSGAALASSETRLRLDINNDGSFDFIPANQATAALGAGATEVENWFDAWTATVGTHQFEICADARLAIAESNEGNNCATQIFDVSLASAAPVVSTGTNHGLTVGSSHAHSGASATDANGNLSSYSWTFTSCPGACPALSGASGALSGGSASISGPTYTPNAAGTYNITLTVTDSGGLSGSDTLAEIASLAPQPDLTVGPNITINGTLIAGQALTFTNSGVTNSGTASAGASTARFCIDNPGCLTSSTGEVNAPGVGALAADAGTGVITSSSWIATAGSHTVYFCADVSPVPPPGAVTESNENNNCAGSGTPFTVGEAFNFSLSNNGDVAVTQGYSTSRIINAALDSGTTQTVNFSASGFPSGASGSFTPSSCSPACSTTLNITTSGSTPAGSYIITVTGTSASLTRTTTFTLTIAGQTLLISSLNVSPNPANPGVSRNITATRDPSSTALGTINYSFWWNCTNTSADVGTVSSACGSLPADAAGGGCTLGPNGAKCNGESATSMTASRAYSLRSTAKVIMEQGAASPAERRTLVDVNLGVSCLASPATAAIEDTVNWTASGTGGTGSYTFTWSGSPPLAGLTGSSVGVVYTTSGQKTGSVTINDGITTLGPVACLNSPIDITGKFLIIEVAPTPINSGDSTTISWTTEQFTSCTLTDDNPDTAINGGPVATNCGIIGFPACPTVNIAVTTVFTLTCDGIPQSVTAQVKPPPSFQEIPPL